MTTEFLKPSKLQCPIFLGFLDSYCICIVCQENLSYQIVVRVCHICIVRKQMYRTKAFLLTFISVTLEHNDYHSCLLHNTMKQFDQNNLFLTLSCVLHNNNATEVIFGFLIHHSDNEYLYCNFLVIFKQI